MDQHSHFAQPASRASRAGYRRAVLASILILAFSISASHAANAQRNPGDILVGEDDDNYYYMDAAAYRGSAAQKFGVQFCRAKLATMADQTAIHELGFDLDAQRFEMFEDVAREQKTALEHKVFDALLDQGLESADALLSSAKSLNPWNVNNAVEMLRAKGFGNAAIIAALRKIALQKDKPAMLAAYREFVDVVKGAKEGWTTRSEIAKDPENSDLRMMVGALKVMQGNPELGLAVTTAEFGESLLYLAYVSGQVGDLEQASNDKLARLARLSQRLRVDVDDTRTSKKAWQKSTGYASARPVCGG